MAKDKSSKLEKAEKVKKPKKTKKIKRNKHKIIKKLGKLIYNILSFIYGLLDKFIVTPIARFMLWVQKHLEGSSGIFDRILNNKVALITLALAISVFSCLLGFYRHNDIMENRSENIVYGKPLEVEYNKAAYVVEGIPEKVDVILIGSTPSTKLAKQSMDEKITLDLTGKKPGTYTVPLKYRGSKIANVNYKIDPSEITVNIYDKVSKKYSFESEVLNYNQLNSEYIITDVKFDKDKVSVSGSEKTLSQVSIVKALVDVTKMTNIEIGTNSLSDLPLVAYDKDGNKLNVEIVPSKIDAKIEIKSPKKEVAFKVIPNGNVVFGKAIDNITLSKTTTTIYGEESVLDKISSIPVNINVEGLSKNNEYTVNIPLPNGVRKMSTTSVTAKVVLSEIQEKTIDNVGITIRNLGNGLTANAASKDDSVCSVIVKGTSSNIKNITAENITASVNLQGIKDSGSYNVKVEVTGDDPKLTYTPKTETVTIKVVK